MIDRRGGGTPDHAKNKKSGSNAERGDAHDRLLGWPKAGGQVKRFAANAAKNNGVAGHFVQGSHATAGNCSGNPR
jgi:hypothetical protein